MPEQTKIEELSSIDIHFLIKELANLLDSKIEQIYQKENTLILSLYKKDENKKFLYIMVPGTFFTAEIKPTIPKIPPQFCTIVRKYLRNARITEIKQIGLERIICISSSTKNGTFHLIAELFGNGNIILCNEQMKIIYPLFYQKWKDRIVKGGQPYEAPKRDWNIKEIQNNDLKKLLKETEKDKIVTFLAIEAGLGGKHAEKICIHANIDKNAKPNETMSESLMQTFTNMLAENIIQNDKIAEIFRKTTQLQENQKIQKTYEQKKSKVETIITTQKKTITKQEKLIEENTQKGDLIYKNYAQIEAILKELTELRKKYSWEKISKQVEKKDHQVLKKIHKTGEKITLELS